MDIESINLKKARQDILTMTSVSQSGHPGGALSSLELLFSIYISANWDQNGIDKREKVVVSNGHIAPGVYTVLGHLETIPIDEAKAYFRYPESPYEGHIENHLPGIAWSTGNLGQGLSAACGFALSEKLNNTGKFVYCLMGDAEQAKGQTSEARKFAKKFGLGNLIALIDRNHIQISGKTEEVMNIDIKENYIADGWKVVSVNGNDVKEILAAIERAKNDSAFPYCILAETTMGNGIPFMEGTSKYHGKTLSEEEYQTACEHLGLENELSKYKEIRKTKKWTNISQNTNEKRNFNYPDKVLQSEKSDLRGKWGNYLLDAAKINKGIIVFDCDLAESVKTTNFSKEFKASFFEAGVMEHNIATVSGALSRNRDINVFWADFGMFNLAEVYNQMRLNDINRANLNVISTHIGIDVGEDGKTHQSIDYIGILRNFYNFKLFLPADFNHLQFILDYVFSHYGNKFIGMGRSKIEPVTKEDGTIYYDKDHNFSYGKIDEIRQGKDVWLLSTGQVAKEVQKAADILNEKGISTGHYHIATPLHFDEKFFLDKHVPEKIFAVEDHNLNSGFGSIISEKLGGYTKIIKIGIDKYFYSGNSKLLYDCAGLSAEKIVERVRRG